jgi:hypothetical protein
VDSRLEAELGKARVLLDVDRLHRQ